MNIVINLVLLLEVTWPESLMFEISWGSWGLKKRLIWTIVKWQTLK